MIVFIPAAFLCTHAAHLAVCMLAAFSLLSELTIILRIGFRCEIRLQRRKIALSPCVLHSSVQITAVFPHRLCIEARDR